jgi:hypothetical protein
MGFNSPAGITLRQDVEMYSRNRFLVHQKYRVTTDPIATTVTMNCSSTLTTTTGVLLDQGGTGNYPASTTCTQIIRDPTASMSTSGYELTVDFYQTEEDGDSLIIEDNNGGRLALSGSTVPPALIVPGNLIKITLKSDNDANTGAGFQLRWRKVYALQAFPFGNAVQFDVLRGSFVSGLHSFDASFQAGEGSANLGYKNIASGFNAVAMGSYCRATGQNSMALGGYVSTNGFSGAFILGDYNPFLNTKSTAADQFTARFGGGYRFFSDYNASLGVQLNPGATAWSTLSDSAKKERFLPLNHADLLTKLRTLRLGTWNYKGQRTERHYGPMAQDFYARFGHDALGVIGCDTLLNSHDFTAVTLSGVQALALENEQLKARVAQLERERSQTVSRLDALERAVLIRPAPRATAITRLKQTR